MKCIYSICFSSFFLINAVACVPDNKEKADSNKGSAAAESLQGSCVQKDTTNNSTMCIERSNPTAFDTAVCKAQDGVWSAKSCDASQYIRLCTQESIETIDNGAPHSVIYKYYYKKDSTFFCAGDETTIGSPAQESTTQPTQEEPSAAIQLGQQLYVSKGCVNCHGAIAVSAVRGHSAETIIRASSLTVHSQTVWPTAEESLPLRDALALSRDELISLGRTTYTDACASCHNTLIQTTVKTKTAAGIAAAKTLTVHSSTAWPNDKLTKALVEAFQNP